MQFILGNFGSGKTSHILKQVISLIKDNKKFLIIVPSRRHKDQLFLQLLQQKHSIIGNPIVTLSELQKKLLEQLYPIPAERPQTISNFEKFLIISSIITQHSKQFKAFKNIQQRPEIIKMIYRLIHSLRDKDIEELKYSPQSEDKIHDIQFILNQFQDILKSKNIGDNKLEINLICQNISVLSQEFFPEYIFIDGFVDYTATQFKLIEHISYHLEQHHKHITITLTDIDHSITNQTTDIFKNKFPKADVLTLQHQNNSTLLANDFLTNTTTCKNLDLYEIQAYGKFKEVEYITNQIKKLCLIDNYNLEDILIITNSHDHYTSLISTSFRKANLPFTFGKDDKLSQNPLIIFIKRCLKIMSQELTHEHIEFFAQSNYIDQNIKKILSKATILLPKAIQGKKDTWQYALQQQKKILSESDEYTPEFLKEFEAFEQTIHTLCDLLFDISKFEEHTITIYINKMLDLLEYFKVFNCLSQTQDLTKHKNIIDFSIAKDYSALLKLKDILSDLKNSLTHINNQELTLTSFLFFFGIITEETRYRSEIPQKNTIKILNTKDTRGIFAKAIFILGLNEGELPSTPNFELFDNFERSQLNLISQKILGQSLWNTDIDFFNEQKLDFATALTRATEKIYFTRTPVNEKGIYFNMSHFLKKIILKYPAIKRIPKIEYLKPEADNSAIYSKKHSAEEYFEYTHLRLFQQQNQISETIKSAYQYTQNIKEANSYFDKEQEAPQHLLSYFGYIPNIQEVVQRYNVENIYISPTRLEKLGRCRYQGLWQNIWKLKPYKLPIYRPEATDYGTLYHYVLEHYIQETADCPPTQTLHKDILHKHLQEYIAINHLSHVFKIDYQYIYTILKGFIKDIEPYLRENQKALYFELTSGESNLECQKVHLNENKSLVVFSKIDRVNFDIISKNYSVIDYKKSNLSSYKNYQKTPFHLFQGFLYSELLKNNNKGPISNISYIFLEKKDIFEEYPGSISKKALYTSIHDMHHFKSTEIARLVELLSQGNFSPFTLENDIGQDVMNLFTEKFSDKFPRESDTKCAYCDLQKLCLRINKKVGSY